MIWSNFETDFKVMFDSCLREKGIEHALGLLHKFSQKVPILSQNQYSYVLSNLPREYIESPAMLKLLIHSKQFCEEFRDGGIEIKYDLGKCKKPWSLLTHLTVLEASPDQIQPLLHLLDERIGREESLLLDKYHMHNYSSLLANGPAFDWYKVDENHKNLKRLF